MSPAARSRGHADEGVLDPWPSVRRWTGACVLGETVGLTAAASAAVAAGRLLDAGGARPVALGLVVTAGVVEGTALGVLQARALRAVLGRAARRWVVATVLVAGLGWAAASAPGVLASDDASGDGSTAGPATFVVLLGAAGLGAVMGAVLGAAQATALRGRVRHPWRWVGVSVLAWIPAMVVIFAFAVLPGAAWPGWSVVVLGGLAGGLAGGCLGLVSGPLLPRLGPVGQQAS